MLSQGMVVHYRVKKQHRRTDEIGAYCTYGLEPQCGRTSTCIDDVSTTESWARRICECCNRGELSLIHFREVVEDFLALENF